MAAKNTAPQRLVIGPWSHVGMRGDATFCHDVDFGPASVWGVQRYFEEQLEFFERWLPDDATGHPDGEAAVRIFVMGGGSGRRTAEGKLDHGGAWRDESEWPLARRVETSYYLHADGSLSTEPPAAGAEPRRFTFDPAHPVPTIGGTVTQTMSTRFGELAGPPATADIEIRASWTPTDDDLGAHLLGWSVLLASTAGLPPPGVTALPARRTA